MAKQINRVDIIQDDVFKDLRESAKLTQKEIASLQTGLVAINESLKMTKEEAKIVKMNASGTGKSNTAEIQKGIELQKEAIRLSKQAEMLNKTKVATEDTIIKKKKLLTLQEAQLNEEIKKQNSLTRQIAQLKKTEAGSVENLRAKLALVTTAWKKLTAEELENTKRGQRLVASKKDLTNQIYKLEKATDDHRRNVGNYESALGKLSGAFGNVTRLAGQFGLAIGGLSILKSGLSTISEFQTQLADLSAVTGLKQTSADFDLLKNKSIELSKQYGSSAKDIVEAFKLAGSARPELLKNGQALSDLTEKAIILSKASGDDVPTSIKNLTGTLNAFDAPASKASEVMDTLANAAQLGTQEIPYLTDAFSKFGGIAASNNVSTAESAAAIEELGKKFPDAATAGTGLRNVLLKISAPDALPKEAITKLKELGINFETLKNKSLPFSERLEALKPLLNDNAALIKTFGSENALAAQTLIASTDAIKKNSEAYGKAGTAQDQANIKSKTLSEATNRLKAEYEAFFLSFESGSTGLTSVIDFLAQNLGSIMSVLGKAVIGFLAYKTALIATNAVQALTNKGLNGIIKGFFDFKKGAEGASGASGKLGNTLKNIGWTAIIALVSELAMEIYNVASGAKLAEYRLQKFNEAVSKGQELGQSKIGKYTESLKKQMQAIDLMNVSEKKRIELRKQAVKNVQSEINAEIKRISQIHAETDAKRKQAIIERDRLKQKQSSYNLSIDDEIALAKAEKTVTSLTSAEKASAEVLKALRTEFGNLKDETHSYNVEQKSLTSSTVKDTKEKEKQTKAYKDASEQINRMNQEMKDSQSLVDEISLYEVDSALQQAVETQLEGVKETGKYTLDIINQLIDREYELKKAIIERQYLESTGEGTTSQQQQDAKIRRDFELGKLENERLEQKNEILKELEAAQEDYAKGLEKSTEVEKKDLSTKRDLYKLATDYFIEQSQKRIDQIDKEIDANQKQYEYLQKLAENGNINAQQSLAEQQKLIAEANAKKEKEIKRQEILKLSQSVYDTYTAKVESGAKNPVVDTIKDVTLLKTFISSLSSFYDGTIDTGAGGGLDGKGGFPAILHPHERVVPANENKGLNGIANSELPKAVDIYQKFQAGNLLTTKQDIAGNSFDLMPLLSELKDLKKTIENKPEVEMNAKQLSSSLFEFSHKVKRGNQLINNRFQYRK